MQPVFLLERRHVPRSARAEGVRRSRLPVRTPGLSAAGDGRAVGQRAAGVRPRRAGGRPPVANRRCVRSTSRTRTTRPVGTDARRASRDGVPARSTASWRHTAIAAATSRTGRCRATARTRRRSCTRFARISRAMRTGDAGRPRSRVRSARPPRRGRRSPQRLSPWQKWTALPRVRRVDSTDQAVLRVARAGALRSGARARDRADVASRAGRRFVERGWLDSRDDYFLLHLDEIAAVIARAASEPRRRFAPSWRIGVAERERHRSLQMPLLMRESELAAVDSHGRASAADPPTRAS